MTRKERYGRQKATDLTVVHETNKKPSVRRGAPGQNNTMEMLSPEKKNEFSRYATNGSMYIEKMKNELASKIENEKLRFEELKNPKLKNLKDSVELLHSVVPDDLISSEQPEYLFVADPDLKPWSKDKSETNALDLMNNYIKKKSIREDDSKDSFRRNSAKRDSVQKRNSAFSNGCAENQNKSKVALIQERFSASLNKTNDIDDESNNNSN